jgi:hypothetical protein
MRKWGHLLGLVSLLLFQASCVFAQGGATGAISGVVQDKSGAAVAGAKVQVLNENTKEVLRTETTDSLGSFTMTLLPAGTYTIEITSANFADTRATGVIVRVTETTRLTLPLQVKSVVQSVEVARPSISCPWQRKTSSSSCRFPPEPLPLSTPLRSLAAAR